MAIAQVAIVGRPNVGKSSILNWLAGRRLAIVDDMAGVTRDRMTHALEHEGRGFELVDTGGIGINDVDDLTWEIEQQIEYALATADLVMFVVDARTGLVPLDQEVAARLRSLKKPVLLVANKVDSEKLEPQADEFYRLGADEVLRVSTQQNRNRTALLDAIVERLPAASTGPEPEPVMKMAIVGRRNVGKSTFINTLVNRPRMIVSEVPGTTRDSVDVKFELDGKPFMAIDTPGVRKRKSIRRDIEYYGLHRAQRSIRRADVVLMFFDAQEKVSTVDRQLVHYIEENHKPCLFVVNKWDLLADKHATGEWAEYLDQTFPTMAYVPIAFITAQTGKNVKKLINHAQMLFKQSLARLSTGELNRLIKRALELHPPPMNRTWRPKVYYATQTAVQPPTIVLMCNDPKAFSASYRRYLLAALRDNVEFAEVPIRLFFDKRESEPRRAKRGE
ncbi:MAG: ribosome biogenesis GTPase Der [Candidatus Anammoximicrobium sp.]|nr:ribosome biogenesis GTPase Der [Candidatus Anammoximicrobium sp.]